MKLSAPIIALIAALIVSGGAIHESNATHADACAAMQREASLAAQAPIEPNATETLGFTPMRQFEKVYPPVCQPLDESAELFDALVGGAIAGLIVLIALGLWNRINRSNHMEKL